MEQMLLWRTYNNYSLIINTIKIISLLPILYHHNYIVWHHDWYCCYVLIVLLEFYCLGEQNEKSIWYIDHNDCRMQRIVFFDSLFFFSSITLATSSRIASLNHTQRQKKTKKWLIMSFKRCLYCSPSIAQFLPGQLIVQIGPVLDMCHMRH